MEFFTNLDQTSKSIQKFKTSFKKYYFDASRDTVA